jgi:tight adherence protein C
VSPYVPAAALAICFLAAARGVVLARDVGPLRARAQGAIRAEREPLGQLVRRALHATYDALAPRATRLLTPQRRATIRERLDAAGKPSGMTIEGYAGRKATFTLLFASIGLIYIVDGNLIVGVSLAALGWLLIDIWLSGEARRRQARVDRDLPDFLDILAVTVGAGVGFRAALARVAEALGGPLASEVETTLHQMDLGASRRDALVALRRRNPSEALGQFVTALLQAEELGVPLADALMSLADDMRRAAYQRARRRAARAAPRVSLIVATLVVPGAVIMIVAALLTGTDIDLGALLGG